MIAQWSRQQGLTMIGVKNIPEGLELDFSSIWHLGVKGTPKEFIDGDGNIKPLKRGDRFTIDFGEFYGNKCITLVAFSDEVLDKCSVKGNVVFPMKCRSRLKFVFTVNKELHLEDIPYFFNLSRVVP